MDDLIAVLRQAHEDTCSLHCPSVWKGDVRPPHSERCQAVEAAIDQVEQLRKQLAAAQATSNMQASWGNGWTD